MGLWSYQTKKYHDRKGRRWHFMFHHDSIPSRGSDEQPYALYFRDDARTAFGVLRFERSKDNPYRSLATVTRKIMDDGEFRATLLDDDTKKVWRGR
jgi:hypothetical protein